MMRHIGTSYWRLQMMIRQVICGSFAYVFVEDEYDQSVSSSTKVYTVYEFSAFHPIKSDEQQSYWIYSSVIFSRLAILV
jgi:hypothetical protein